MALAPSDPENHVSKARILNASGRAVEAEAEVRKAMRFDPRFSPAMLHALSIAQFHQERYQEAADTIERIIALGSGTTDDYSTLVSALGHLRRADKVQAAIDGYNKIAISSSYDPLTVQESQWFWNGDVFNYYRPYIDRLLDGLRKAGVPEGAGTDLSIDAYKRLITRTGGEFVVEGATAVNALQRPRTP